MNSRAEFCLKFRSFFGQWIFKKKFTALQNEETLVSCCAISEYCAILFVLLHYHGFIALMDRDLVRLVFEVAEEFVLVEEHVESFIV